MRLRSWKDIGTYVFVAVLAVGGAASLSLKFLKPAVSQENQPPPFPPGTSPGMEFSGDEQNTSPTLPPAYEGDVAAPEEVGPRPMFPVVTEEGGMASSARELEVFLEPFLYDSGGRRSPFEPFEERGTAERGFPLGPLQRYGLEEFNLIGIMWDIKSPKAMFVDPAGQVHVAGRDEGIGRKNGYIAAIREGEVVVVEAEQKDSGIIYETKVIQLLR